MHSLSFVFDGNVFTITFRGTLCDGPVFSYGVLPYRGLASSAFIYFGAASCVEKTASGETPALHRARNHQLFVHANDANRGPAGIRGNRPRGLRIVRLIPHLRPGLDANPVF